MWDSPNSAGIVIDARRARKIAIDRSVGGQVLSAGSHFMQSPPVQCDDSTSRDDVELFIQQQS